MAPPLPPRPTPAALSHLIIFNPSLKPAPGHIPTLLDGTEYERDDIGEAAQILFHYSSEHSDKDKVLRQFGLAKGLMGFAE